jgi:hypothetical protein
MILGFSLSSLPSSDSSSDSSFLTYFLLGAGLGGGFGFFYADYAGLKKFPPLSSSSDSSS